MNFLFDNPLANMQGGMFLFLYAVVILIALLGFYWIKSKLDWTSEMPLPQIPTEPDPYEIAYMRGGVNELARSVIFSLVHKGFLQVSNEGKKSFISMAPTQPNWTTLPPIEKGLLGWFQSRRDVKEIFGQFGLAEMLQPLTGEYERKLVQGHFLNSTDHRSKVRLLAILVFGGTLLLGVYKLIAAITHGRFNIVFLIIFLVVLFFIAMTVGKAPRLSNLGQRYLNALQTAFENLKARMLMETPRNGQAAPTMASVDPFLLAMGIFGVGALTGTAYSEYERAFHRAGATGGTGSSGCGSGCGSSCSSGDGGGGCGGCGGGD